MSFLLRRKRPSNEHDKDNTHNHNHILSGKPTRALFRRRPQRSAIMASLAVVLPYFVHKWVPRTAFARVVGEMVVAFISLTALTLLILAHHGKGGHGRIMNQTQEEIMLISIFGLFWFALLLGIREWNDRHISSYPTPSETWGMSAPPLSQSAQVRACPGGTLMCVMQGMSGGIY